VSDATHSDYIDPCRPSTRSPSPPRRWPAAGLAGRRSRATWAPRHCPSTTASTRGRSASRPARRPARRVDAPADAVEQPPRRPPAASPEALVCVRLPSEPGGAAPVRHWYASLTAHSRPGSGDLAPDAGSAGAGMHCRWQLLRAWSQWPSRSSRRLRTPSLLAARRALPPMASSCRLSEPDSAFSSALACRRASARQVRASPSQNCRQLATASCACAADEPASVASITAMSDRVFMGVFLFGLRWRTSLDGTRCSAWCSTAAANQASGRSLPVSCLSRQSCRNFGHSGPDEGN